MATNEKSRSGRKISNSLVAVSSAAVLAVYTAGYLKTKPAADRFDEAVAQRRVADPPAAAAFSTVSPPPQATREVTSRPPASSPRITQPTRPSLAESPTTPAAPETAPALDTTPAPEPFATIETAPAGIPTIPDLEPQEAAPLAAPEAAPRGPYKDGTYTGWGYSRHGDIEATVIVEEGRIASAQISKCQTRYPCAGVVDHLPGQVLSRQRAHIDFVSGATQSSYAYEDAVAQALAKAQ